MNKTLFTIIFLVIFLCACENKTETYREQFAELTLNDVLTNLNDVGIQYVERTETLNAYDIQREGAERHLYQLISGNLTIYIFSSVAERREVQGDPFPAAGVVPQNGTYGMDRILVFYYDGNTTMAEKLIEAFKPLGVEEQSLE